MALAAEQAVKAKRRKKHNFLSLSCWSCHQSSDRSSRRWFDTGEKDILAILEAVCLLFAPLHCKLPKGPALVAVERETARILRWIFGVVSLGSDATSTVEEEEEVVALRHNGARHISVVRRAEGRRSVDFG